MNDVWIVIGNASGDVSYGVDEHYYILGIHPTEEAARSVMSSLASSEDDVKVSSDDDRCYLVKGCFGVIVRSTKGELDDDDIILKYRDLQYYVTHFTGTPVFCGGGCYLE